MRVVVGVLALAACGRVGFDARTDGGKTAFDDSGIPLPPLTCSRATTPITTIGESHLAANVIRDSGGVASGLAAAWAPAITAQSPAGGRLQIAHLDLDGLVKFGPSLGTSTVFDQVGAILQISNALLVQAALLGIQETTLFDTGLSFASTHSTGSGVLGAGCIVPALDGTNYMITASATTLYSSYVTSGGVSSQSVRSYGMALADLTCHSGPDHVHVGWTDGSACGGTGISLGGSTPSIGGSTPFDNDCTTVRSTAVDAQADTSQVIWRRGNGTLTTAFFVDMPEVIVNLSSDGTAHRVSYDGTHAWFAWLEGPSSQLTVAYKAPQGTTVLGEAALEAVVPAGIHAFELVRGGNATYLVVITRDSTLQVYRLCAN